MKTILSIAAAVLIVAACSDSGNLAQITDPELAKGKPDPNEVCEEIVDARIDALCTETQDATAFLSAPQGPNAKGGAAKDEAGLIGQLNRADQKCNVDGDLAGALGKLTDFQVKVMSLIADGKIDPTDGDELLNGGGATEGNVGVNALLAEGALVCG